jgi:hypothetical protein
VEAASRSKIENLARVGCPKKKGEVHPVSAVRLPPEVAPAVDGWAEKQDGDLTRSEAIRRLVEIGLKAKGQR